MEENREYTLREVAEITGLSNDLIRLYEKEFNLVVDRTEGGHRRFSKKNIEEFVAIRKRIQEQNWSYDQVRAWRNGQIEPLLEDERIRSNLEKEVEALREDQQKTTELLKAVVEKLGEQNQLIHRQQQYIEESINRRDQELMTHLRALHEGKLEREKPRGFVQRLIQALKPGN